MNKRREFFTEASKKSFDKITARFGMKFDFSEKKAADISKTETPLLKSGSPINEKGHTFGGAVSGMALVPFGIGLNGGGEGALVVCGHYGEVPVKTGLVSKSEEEKIKKASFGISILEFKKTDGRWLLVTKSPRAIRVSSATVESLPVEGATFDAENAKMNPVYAESKTIAPITAVSVTPWETVLCTELKIDDDSGYVLEVNPRSGLVAKRFAIGKIDAHSISFLTGSEDRRLHLKFNTTRPETIEFTSFQNFDSKNMGVNQRILNCGTITKTETVTAPFALAAGFKLPLDQNAELVCRNNPDGSVELSLLQ